MQPKVTKKKKFKEKNSERIENDLFAGENKPPGKSGKKTSTKKKRKKTEENAVCYFCYIFELGLSYPKSGSQSCIILIFFWFGLVA